MADLKQILVKNEDRLMEKILSYAKQQEYTKYTSTLLEAWRISIAGITQAICDAIDMTEGKTIEFSPDEIYSDHPITQFGIVQAHNHRKRGISLSMFLGLLKYYRQAYQDLIKEAVSDLSARAQDDRFVVRCFDMFEIALCSEWAQLSETRVIDDLQVANRQVTNEKNMYLTVFESLLEPVILVDEHHYLTNMNLAAVRLLGIMSAPGEMYYAKTDDGGSEPGSRATDNIRSRFAGEPLEAVFPWLASSIKGPKKISEQEEKVLRFGDKEVYFRISVSPMLDVSQKYSGALIVISDMTKIRQAQEQVRFNEERLRYTMEATRDGMWDWNIQSGGIFFSPRYLSMLGFSTGELEPSYQTWRNLVHPEDITEVEKKLSGYIASGEGFEFSYRMRTRADDYLWVLNRGRVVQTDENGHALRMVGTHMDITEQKQMEADIRKLAATDSLTGANNRRRFMELAEIEYRRSIRYKLPLAALMIDIDHFKTINDTFGHVAGDKALCDLTRVCLKELRTSDVFGRIGGEEFGVILAQTGGDEALRIAERLRRKVSEIVIIEKGSLIQFTISVGVAVPGRMDEGALQLLNQADQALYQAKESGRNRVKMAG